MAANSIKAPVFKFIKYWIPVIIYAILIFYFSSLGSQDLPDLFIGQSLLAHLVEFALLAFLISRGLKGYLPQSSRQKRFFWAIAISLVYASTDEFHQSFVPGRTVSAFDLLLDAAGSLIGSLLYK